MSFEGRYRLNSDQVQKFLPHRAPFLLVDRVLDIFPVGDLDDASSQSSKEGVRVIAQKCVTVTEPHFQGHFPGFSIMPGVLLVEAMAQAASFSLYPYLEKNLERLRDDFRCILVGVNGARFRKPVVPGDVLKLEAVVTKCRGRLWVFETSASVDGHKVAEAELMANLLLKGEGL